MRQSLFDGFFDPWSPRGPRRESPPSPPNRWSVEAQRREAVERRRAEEREALRREAARREALLREARHREAWRREEARLGGTPRAPEARAAERSAPPAVLPTTIERAAQIEHDTSADETQSAVSSGDPTPASARPGRAPSSIDDPAPIVGPSGASLALLHATEELEAARARLERDRERALADTKVQVVEKMLPVLDNLDRSVEAAANSPDAALRDGVNLVRAQFEEALASLGLTRVAALGEAFDPAVHEAIATVEVDDPAAVGRVVDEWRRGYRLGGRLIRSPQVRVARSRA